ncbi:MAG: hypothetical protein ACON5B_12030 [Myxococcota bacterium]
MADEQNGVDAELGFRAEMAVTDFVMRYAVQLGAVVGVALLGTLMWGVWDSYNLTAQQNASSEISQILRELDTPAQQLSMQRAMGQEVETDGISSTAQSLEAAADGMGYPANAEALLQAAELHRLAGSADAQRAALTKASALSSGMLAFAAEGGLASLDMQAGDADAAIGRWQAFTSSSDTFLAREATRELARTLVLAGKADQAVNAFDNYLNTWPDAADAETVREERERAAAEQSG